MPPIPSAHAAHAAHAHAAHAAAHAAHAATHAAAHAAAHAAHAHATHAAHHAAAHAAHAAESAASNPVCLDRQYEVGHRVDLGGHVLFALGLCRRSDEEHFVVDHVLQLQFVQQQLQGRAERNALEILRNRRALIDARLFQGRGIELDLDVVQVLEIIDDVLQRRLDEFDRGRLLQGFFDLLFGSGCGAR